MKEVTRHIRAFQRGSYQRDENGTTTRHNHHPHQHLITISFPVLFPVLPQASPFCALARALMARVITSSSQPEARNASAVVLQTWTRPHDGPQTRLKHNQLVLPEQRKTKKGLIILVHVSLFPHLLRIGLVQEGAKRSPPVLIHKDDALEGFGTGRASVVDVEAARCPSDISTMHASGKGGHEDSWPKPPPTSISWTASPLAPLAFFFTFSPSPLLDPPPSGQHRGEEEEGVHHQDEVSFGSPGKRRMRGWLEAGYRGSLP